MWGGIRSDLFGGNSIASHFVHYPNKKQEEILKKIHSDRYEKIYKT